MKTIKTDEKIVKTCERRSYAGVEGKNGYGYVWVKVGEEDFEPVYEPRKVTASLRVAIILDYIYDHNGEQATVKFFAKALGVCDYTIQKTLHLLEQIGCIEIVPTKSKELGQTANIYYYCFGIYTAKIVKLRIDKIEIQYHNTSKKGGKTLWESKWTCSNQRMTNHHCRSISA